MTDHAKSTPKLPRTAWKKGQSGNPGGRPKAALDVREMARQQTPLAINALIEVVSDPESSQRVAAAKVLLDRGWGQAMQHHEHTGKDGGPIQYALSDEGRAMLEDTMAAMQARRPAAKSANGAVH